MTQLTITPKVSDKAARFKGAVAAGEHVAVTIQGGADWLGEDDGANLTLRVIDRMTGRTLAVFPRPAEVLEDGEEPDAWSASEGDLTCTLNLNTDRMVAAARHMIHVPVKFVLGDTDDPRTLYFSDDYQVDYWPERIGDTTPYDLNKWPKQIDEWSQLVSEMSASLNSHIGDTSNPHFVTKVQVGLGNVDNTSDLNKPISTAAQSALDGKVDKVEGKGLSENDFTDTLKSKLDGIAEGANNYTLPPATASTLGGVKQGTGCTIEQDGTLNVTGGGGGGETPVAPSTDASAQGKPADAKATGDALAGKRGLKDLAVYFEWALTWAGDSEPVPLTRVSGLMPETWTDTGDLATATVVMQRLDLFTWRLGSQAGDAVARDVPQGATEMVFVSGADNVTVVARASSETALVTGDTLARTSQLAAKQDKLTVPQLAAANSGATSAKVATWDDYAAQIADKADAADLRYRIAEAGLAASLPTGVTVWLDSEEVTNYAIVSDVGADRFELQVADQTACIWDLDGTNGDPYGAEFKDGGGVALSTPPDLVIFRALADRTVNLITADNETSIDIELPDAVTVDGVRYCRDFILDVDNSANASDLALEFTALGTQYAFVPLEDDSISEMMTIGAGERVRLYFTETPYHATGSLPVINVARVTLGDFVDSTTPATQGGN